MSYKGGESMSELCDIAFKFCLKAKERKLNKHQALWLVEIQYNRVKNMEFTLDELEGILRRRKEHEQTL